MLRDSIHKMCLLDNNYSLILSVRHISRIGPRVTKVRISLFSSLIPDLRDFVKGSRGNVESGTS